MNGTLVGTCYGGNVDCGHYAYCGEFFGEPGPLMVQINASTAVNICNPFMEVTFHYSQSFRGSNMNILFWGTPIP